MAKFSGGTRGADEVEVVVLVVAPAAAAAAEVAVAVVVACVAVAAEESCGLLGGTGGGGIMALAVVLAFESFPKDAFESELSPSMFREARLLDMESDTASDSDDEDERDDGCRRLAELLFCSIVNLLFVFELEEVEKDDDGTEEGPAGSNEAFINDCC